jgi:hypothetical protein
MSSLLQLYSENKEGSELCSCKQGSRLDCTFLQANGPFALQYIAYAVMHT